MAKKFDGSILFKRMEEENPGSSQAFLAGFQASQNLNDMNNDLY